MKRLIAMLVVVAAFASQASAAGAGLGFDILGTLFMPSDSRVQAVGTGVTLNLKVDENLTLGYRVSELEARYEHNSTSANWTMRTHGLIAMYKAFSLDKMSIEGGLFVGNGKGYSVTTPVLEPMARLVYTTVGKIDTRILLSVGYAFARHATYDLGGTEDIDNMDGLDISFGVGLGF